MKTAVFKKVLIVTLEAIELKHTDLCSEPGWMFGHFALKNELLA